MKSVVWVEVFESPSEVPTDTVCLLATNSTVENAVKMVSKCVVKNDNSTSRQGAWKTNDGGVSELLSRLSPVLREYLMVMNSAVKLTMKMKKMLV